MNSRQKLLLFHLFSENMLFSSYFSWVRLFFPFHYFLCSLLHHCQLASKVGWKLEVIWAEPQTYLASGQVEVMWSYSHLEGLHPFLWLILLLLQWGELKGSNRSREPSPVETLVPAICLCLSQIYCLLCWKVMAEKKRCTVLNMMEKLNKISGISKSLAYLIYVYKHVFPVS